MPLQYSSGDVRRVVAQAIELEVEALETRGDVTAAGFRREQADAVRALLGTITRTAT
jgi:hypothetical protein